MLLPFHARYFVFYLSDFVLYAIIHMYNNGDIFMPTKKINTKKSKKMTDSVKYTNMFHAYAAFWRRGFTEWAGTSSRSEYWWSQLMNALIGILGAAAIVLVAMFENTWFGETGLGAGTFFVCFLLWSFVIATIIPRISQITRRLHDVGLSAWWWLLFVLAILPILGFVPVIFFFVVSLLPTKVKDNPYHKFNK